MGGEGSGDFEGFLGASGLVLADPANARRPLRQVWEASELTAGDFADEVASFYRLPRIALPELMAAPSSYRTSPRAFCAR